MKSFSGYVKSLKIPGKKSRKGDNGRLLIIGGSKKYHGAPILAILGARRFCDLVYFLPGQKDQRLINAAKTIPEVIVIDKLEEAKDIDCVLFGCGLGNARFDIKKIRSNNLVIDADGLKRFRGKIPNNAIITPHEGEFKGLFGINGSRENVEEMAGQNECIILKKGTPDIISDGKRTIENKTHNPGMTRGGTGDVLAGLVAALRCINPAFESAAAGAYLNGMAGNLAKKEFGLNFCASDVAERLAHAMKRAGR
jgi:NAD(P)H-hydrate epimerase